MPGVGVPARASRLRGTFISATPLLFLGLTVFVVALNMRHYSTTLDTDSAREDALHRAAMEMRIAAIEKEVLQNSLFVEKVLEGLDEAFQASAKLSVAELRRLARTEASDLGEQRARKPPPPMSDFAASRVAAAVGGGKLQDLVEAAVSADTGFSSGQYAAEAGPNGGNAGWDWGPASGSSASDDFLGSNEVEVVEPVKLDVSEEERGAACGGWLKNHNVVPGVDWGTLPTEQQKLWKVYRCDEIALEAAQGR